MNKRIALGTVQFGLPYGVANRTGQVGNETASAILAAAWDSGIDTLDTAIAYGESETRLGEIGCEKWKIVSKLPAMPEQLIDSDIEDWVRDSIHGSLKRLGVPRLYGLLLHRSGDLAGERGKKLISALATLKSAGLVKKTGISIYDPDELEILWPTYHPDLVQAPFNVIDRRLATSGWLAKLHANGIETHIRSIFLQGLLLMPASQRPIYFQRWQALWAQWDNWLGAQSLTPLQACLQFALAQTEVNRVVIGIDNLEQLWEIVGHARLSAGMVPESLISNDNALVNPSRWKTA